MGDPDADGTDYDVVVVGCGPVGATAANLLGQSGLRTLVLDRHTGVVDIPRAIHLDASVMRVFQSAGLSETIEPDCRVLDSMSTYGAQGQLLSTSSSGANADGWAEHYSFYQPTLEVALRAGIDRFDNVEVRLGALVTDVDSTAERAEVVWEEDGQTRRTTTRFLLASDGASSTVRRLLGLTLEDLDFDEPWLVVDALVEGDHGLPDSTSQMFCDPDRPTTLVPGPGQHRRWEFMLLPGEDPAVVSTPAYIERLLSKYVDPSAASIIRASVYRFHALMATSWRAGPVILAGDAAHQTPPFLGQGMCHGIRDVQSLTWRLAAIVHGEATGAVLDLYERERRPQVSSVIHRAVAKGREICVLDPVLAAERDKSVADGSGWGQTLDSTMTLGITDGLIHASRPRQVAPLPQPWVQLSGAPPERLDDVLPSGFFVLTDSPELVVAGTQIPFPILVIVDDTGEQQSRVGVHDSSGAVRGWLATAHAAAALVRPDRHAYGFADSAIELSRLCTDLQVDLTGGLVDSSP